MASPDPLRTPDRGPFQRLEATLGLSKPIVARLEPAVLVVATAVSGAGIALTVAAAWGFFRIAAPFVLGALGACLFLVGWATVRKHFVWLGDRYDIIALALAIVSAVLAGGLHHQHLAAATDVGFYANDAIIIGETGGRLLHHPADTTLPAFQGVTGGARLSSMFGYSSLAALLVYVWGATAVHWVNAPLIAIALLSIYQVGRRIGATWGSLFGIAFYGTSYVTVWLSRYVMTENAATAIFWVSVLLVLRLAESWRPIEAAGLAIAQTYGILVRPEGPAIALWFALVVLALRRADVRAIATDKSRLGAFFLRRGNQAFVGTFVACAAAIVIVSASAALPVSYLLASLSIALPVLKGQPKPDSFDVPTVVPRGPPAAGPGGEPVEAAAGPTWGDYILRYEWDSALAYYLPLFMAVVALGLALKLIPWRRALLVTLCAVPYGIFVLMPPVTTEQPFYMRRLWVAWLPLLYLLAGVALDLRKATWRWPRRTRRGTRPRWDSAIVCGMVGMILMVPHLDVVAPVLDRRINDGSYQMLGELEERLPHDAVLIVDEDLIRFSTPIRVHVGNPTVTWFSQAAVAFQQSFLSTAGEPTYILALNASSLPVLETDADGTARTQAFRVAGGRTLTNRLLEYISKPPLEQGYKPFAQYLNAAVPPDRWVDERFDVLLVEAKPPLVIQKNIDYGFGWRRDERGLVATGDNGTLNLDLSLYSPEILNVTNFGVYLAYMQVQAGPIQLTALRTTNAPPITLNLTSDGSGTIAFALWSLPIPADVRLILVPKGTVMRGIFFGLDQGLPKP